uniref:Uncharacterized protein n=1 Tax=Ditylenchus dipsaci TaxID=166011 RepID=A0A915DLM9_9BILA
MNPAIVLKHVLLRSASSICCATEINKLKASIHNKTDHFAKDEITEICRCTGLLIVCSEKCPAEKNNKDTLLKLLVAPYELACRDQQATVRSNQCYNNAVRVTCKDTIDKLKSSINSVVSTSSADDIDECCDHSTNMFNCVSPLSRAMWSCGH